ncbi:alkaline phosphatase D family protein [Nocardia sp. NPDC051832]|uniref:alkaline phosphatase D family protein n=1 Tax=Nocardia sp. NPDC051832 TaxID=3155673 RepID=UPI003445CAB6
MSLSRRAVLAFGIAGLAGAATASSALFPAPRWRGSYPFALGVASGDPLPDGVVLWTRLAPDPLAADGLGGMPHHPVTVEYEVAHDANFQRIATRGSAVATRELGHSVHPEVHGLEPDRWYFYRFRAGSAISPTGRTRTAPAAGTATARMRLAVASCQSWASGYYTAYEHLAREDVDLVLHLGDYIYERAWNHRREGTAPQAFQRGEAVDLRGYRLRYAQAKAEQPLQAAHAAFPWLVTMDDHEVDNNWAGDNPGLGFDISWLPPLFQRRRADAFQAMYEHQPLRLAQMPSGPDLRLHRRYRFGDLADVTMLDTRQYRSPIACSQNPVTGCAERFDTDRTILGAAQRDWLIDGFTDSPARWQLLGNQVAMSEVDTDPGPDVRVSTDAWDGYVADRNRVLGAAAERQVGNLVVVTGDKHENCASNLRSDFSHPESPVVGTEFTGTSISTNGNGADMTEHGRRLLAANPDLKFFNAQRGYLRLTLEKSLCRTDFRVVPFVTRPGAPVHTRASYIVEDGIPGTTEA